MNNIELLISESIKNGNRITRGENILEIIIEKNVMQENHKYAKKKVLPYWKYLTHLLNHMKH